MTAPVHLSSYWTQCFSHRKFLAQHTNPFLQKWNWQTKNYKEEKAGKNTNKTNEQKNDSWVTKHNKLVYQRWGRKALWAGGRGIPVTMTATSSVPFVWQKTAASLSAVKSKNASPKSETNMVIVDIYSDPWAIRIGLFPNPHNLNKFQAISISTVQTHLNTSKPRKIQRKSQQSVSDLNWPPYSVLSPCLLEIPRASDWSFLSWKQEIWTGSKNCLVLPISLQHENTNKSIKQAGLPNSGSFVNCTGIWQQSALISTFGQAGQANRGFFCCHLKAKDTPRTKENRWIKNSSSHICTSHLLAQRDKQRERERERAINTQNFRTCSEMDMCACIRKKVFSPTEFCVHVACSTMHFREYQRFHRGFFRHWKTRSPRGDKSSLWSALVVSLDRKELHVFLVLASGSKSISR